MHMLWCMTVTRNVSREGVPQRSNMRHAKGQVVKSLSQSWQVLLDTEADDHLDKRRQVSHPDFRNHTLT